MAPKMATKTGGASLQANIGATRTRHHEVATGIPCLTIRPLPDLHWYLPNFSLPVHGLLSGRARPFQPHAHHLLCLVQCNLRRGQSPFTVIFLVPMEAKRYRAVRERFSGISSNSCAHQRRAVGADTRAVTDMTRFRSNNPRNHGLLSAA